MRTAVANVHDLEPSWVAGISAAVTAMLGAAGLWLANRLMGKAAFQTAINNGFKALLDEVQEDRAELRRTLEKERAEAAVERAQLRGEIRGLTQVIESLKVQLRTHGIPIPEARKPSPHEAAAGVIELKANAPPQAD